MKPWRWFFLVLLFACLSACVGPASQRQADIGERIDRLTDQKIEAAKAGDAELIAAIDEALALALKEQEDNAPRAASEYEDRRKLAGKVAGVGMVVLQALGGMAGAAASKML